VKVTGVRAVLYAALVIVYLLHNDLWFWNDAREVLGLPVGLAYHIVYCLAAAGLMALLVRFAWPTSLGDETEGTPGR
jgi:hypothetical protein